MSVQNFSTTVRIFLIYFLCCFVFACSSTNGKDKIATTDSIPPGSKNDATIPGNFSSQTTIKFDSTRISSFLEQYPLLKPIQANLFSFYRGRKFAFAWYDDDGLIEQAANLYNRMQNIHDEGLPDKLPYKQEFTSLMNDDGTDSATGKPSVYAELMISAQYFVYASNVWQGISEKQTLAAEWYLPRKKLSYSNLLDSLLSGKDLLDSAPVYRQYGLLKNELKKYKEIQSGGGFPLINADKKSYKKGDSSAVIDSIRKTLFITGDLNSNNGSNIFDDELETGVRNFQLRIGQKPDAVIGSAVLTELKVPVENRIQQIIVNMERSRWVPVSVQSNYIVVNIPEYQLHVYENDSLIWNMNVVVGQPAHKTVIFNGNIKYVVFSPYWNVPSGILNKEVLPGIKRNKNYLASHNMEWNGGHVRQKPGPNNSLGLVKFLFPNSYDIYLHDTPSKSLFGENNRAFSHGCIRLSEPEKMANYLLRNDSSWTKEKINAAMHAGKEKYVTLKETVPVFIAYFTAWVDRDGKLNFRKDVYGRDSRLDKMIMEKPVL
ncbi:MAG TPA: L,D-transpeptidase family protein [Panacibacter sp.]|nr:L,D-transpeptidase family protein [Panacibacter sp.]